MKLLKEDPDLNEEYKIFGVNYSLYIGFRRKKVARNILYG